MTDENTDWGRFDAWHHLLDAMCVEQGYLDNMKLADAFCAAAGSSTQSAFDAALKNLRNWRAGTHVPQRRNFLLLTRLLKIDAHEGLRPVWNDLYFQARSRPHGEAEEPAPAPERETASEPRRRSWHRPALAAAVTGVVATGAGWYVWAETRPDPDEALFGQVNANYVRNVTARVGDAMIIHGARGNNCGPAPAWEVTKELLPEPVTGTLSDGGLGTRYSRQCGGNVAARAILFTATEAGTEQFNLYGDPVMVTVTE